MEIGFIDYSPQERNRILSTLSMLGDRTALDELGIGVMRDAYSDLLFPGISTLQTRAKYFVLLPYLFHSAEEQARRGKLKDGRAMLDWIRSAEDSLAATLTTNCPKSEIGIIGSDAYQNKRTVKNKPSAIYWNGMRTFGIFCGGNLSILDACKHLCSSARRKAAAEIRADGESFDDPTAANQGSALFLPIRPDYDYEKQATMDLTRKEAVFLKDCITRSPVTAHSLLAFFVEKGIVSCNFEAVPMDLLPEGLRRDYLLARDFARFIYGAHIRYNVIFSQYTDMKMIQRYDSWREEFLAQPFELEPVLERVSCPSKLSYFCSALLDEVQKDDTAALDDLIVWRERQVKGNRAKLRKPEEYLYHPDHPIHDYQLKYRYDTASRIVRDILNGLGEESHV